MESLLTEKNTRKRSLNNIVAAFILTLALGGFLSIVTISMLNSARCDASTKEYKMTPKNDGDNMDLLKLPKKDQSKFIGMLDNCKKQREFDSKIFSKSSSIYLLVFPIVFISVFLGAWAYAIGKYGFLIGGSIGILPPIIIAFVLSLLWPLMILTLLFLVAFKTQYIEIAKEIFSSPFRAYGLNPRTVSNP